MFEAEMMHYGILSFLKEYGDRPNRIKNLSSVIYQAAKNEIISIEQPLGYNLDIKRMICGIKDKNIKRVPFENYLSFKILTKALKEHKKIKMLWKRLTKEKLFRDSFEYKNTKIFRSRTSAEKLKTA